MFDGLVASRFVVQRHDARTLHYDFRLEKDGVFKSWVVPKGIPQEPGVRRLAIQTEDHVLKFCDFEGEIPEGKYGAGVIEIWDLGTYDLVRWSDDHIEFALHGSRFCGTYHLVKFRRAGEREWLIFKTDKPVT